MHPPSNTNGHAPETASVVGDHRHTLAVTLALSVANQDRQAVLWALDTITGEYAGDPEQQGLILGAALVLAWRRAGQPGAALLRDLIHEDPEWSAVVARCRGTILGMIAASDGPPTSDPPPAAERKSNDSLPEPGAPVKRRPRRPRTDPG